MTMDPHSVRRREVLGMASTIPLAAIAGCLDVLAGADRHEYANAIPTDGTTDTDGVFFVHVDAEWLRAFDGTEELPYAETFPDAVDFSIDPHSPPVTVDPLLAYPAAAFVAGAVRIGLGLVPYGFGDVILDGVFEDVASDHADDPQQAVDEPDVDGTVRIDSMLLVDDVGVFRGAFDARTIVGAARDFEPVGERADFDRYEGSDAGVFGTDGLAFAVRDDLLVTLFDDEASLDPVLASIADDADGLGDGDDGGWALEEAGHGHISLGAWGVDPERAADGQDHEFVATPDVLEDATGVVSSLTLGPDEGVGTMAVRYETEATPQRAVFERQIGTSASARDIDLRDGRAAVAGIWRVPDANG